MTIEAHDRSTKARDATHCDQVEQNGSKQTTSRTVHAAEPLALRHKKEVGTGNVTKTQNKSETWRVFRDCSNNSTAVKSK